MATRKARIPFPTKPFLAKPFLAKLFLAKLFPTLLLLAVLTTTFTAHAADPYPLRPPPTSSPRATFQSFMEITTAFFTATRDNLAEYANSDRLYPTSAEFQAQAQAYTNSRGAIALLDLSNISPVLRESLVVERVLLLREIFDRIDLPAYADIPNREDMVRLNLKRWRVPETEIDIVLIEEGPRAGEYLFSAATVDRLPEFFERIKDVPSKSTPAQELRNVYAKLSGGRVHSLYEAYLSSPLGLGRIVPVRWILRLPAWAQASAFGVTVWQWAGLALGALLAALLLNGAWRLSRRIGQPGVTARRATLHSLPVPLAILVLTEFFLPIWSKIFHIGGPTLIAITYLGTSAFFLTAAWLSFIGSIIIGEMLAKSEHVERSSLDNQLVRLGTRLAGIIGAVAIMMAGADKLGFPAYSVLAGLGVGGLAVALAARDTVANFLGSMLIMFEKPFRVGDVVRLAGAEGTVEDVGFRSTRIRTAENSLLSIPSNSVVNAVVENLSLRPARRQRFFVQVGYDTPRAKVEELIAAIRAVLEEHPLTNKTNIQVRLNNFGAENLDILVQFHLTATDATTELREREAILLKIMECEENLGVGFVARGQQAPANGAPASADAAGDGE